MPDCALRMSMAGDRRMLIARRMRTAARAMSHARQPASGASRGVT